MESGADENLEQSSENISTFEEMNPVQHDDISSAPAADATGSCKQGEPAQELLDSPDQDDSVKLPSFVKNSTPVNKDPLKQALLGTEDVGAVGDESVTDSKKKKKKKRPKSAQTSSSSGSILPNPATDQTDSGPEVALTNSVEAMSVSVGAAAAPPSETKEKKKKKKKKKKKEKLDASQDMVDVSSVDVEMKDVDEREGADVELEEKEEQQDILQVSSSLQPLTQNLSREQKMSHQQCQEQQQIAQRMQQYPVMQQQMPQHPVMQQQTVPHPVVQQQGHIQLHQNQKQQQEQQKGNNTPKGGQKHKKQHQKKNVFEPYWSKEDMSAGLKRGTLIEGPIRINPKNYEDSYVPLPDGTADVYICGMADRNRALNGDVVAVLVQDRDHWRVFTEEVDHYEKCNSPLKNEQATDAETEMAEKTSAKEAVSKTSGRTEEKEVDAETADKTKETEAETEMADKTKEMDTDDKITDKTSEKIAEKENEIVDMNIDSSADGESPDVLVEEEEEVELDSSGRPIEGTHVTTPVTGSAATPSQAVSVPQSPVPGTQKGGKGGRGARSKDKKGGSSNAQGASCKAKRYKSVKEVREEASPVVRKLFDGSGASGGEEGEERSGINADRFMQRTGKVVAILEKKHSRASSGSLRRLQDRNHNFAIFAPNDSRVPRIMIPTNELPPGFKERPEDFTKTLFIARITEWNETSKMPKGVLARSLGEAGQLEPETEALLAENSIDCSDFSEEVLACLPQESPWTIPAKELQWRHDLRKECVFTIDPSTARDLDDALHCTDLGDGMYEVGVHIADVSYFVTENTELDEVARKRATSVYLVQKVIPMLPQLLCEQLCSLNPDEDRLTFSVIWTLTEDGQILKEWFGRSVIRSCVKLSYDHAQGFIEEPEREWTAEELPPITGGFTVNDIKIRVLQMNKIAKALRKARFDSGALRLDQVKIQFTLNKELGLPNGYFVYQQRDSNKLVEEFMLLANMAVAHKIRSTHKEKALLRRHPPPQSRMIQDLKELCSSLGFPMEVDTAKDIQLSLAHYMGEDELSQAQLQVLVALCSRPMRNAKYFCCGMLADETLYSHYALNVPLYTHFTSPIRRYPDILVHRTLAAALGYCEITDRGPHVIQDIAEHCNTMKTNAKQCSERSNEIYFAVFVKEAGPLEEKGMVMSVLDRSFDVYILKLGVVKRVYCERLPLEKFTHRKEGKRQELILMWKPDDSCPKVITQKLSIFSSVNCMLQSEPEPLKWSAFIRRPVDGDVSIVM